VERIVPLLYRVAGVIVAIAGIIALIIGIAITFRVFGGNPDNVIVSFFDDLARTLVGPFDGMFKPKDRRAEIAINWGIAVLAYVLVGRAVAGLLRRAGPAEP
jgi:hypothetical protein